jgi:hypothetical protein
MNRKVVFLWLRRAHLNPNNNNNNNNNNNYYYYYYLLQLSFHPVALVHTRVTNSNNA